MAVKGIGIDIVEVGRIAEMIRKYGNHFLGKVYTPAEIAYCRDSASPAIHFAGRWAVKEAFYKALPEDCQPHSWWKSIEVVPDAGTRRPAVKAVDEALRESMRAAQIDTIHVSISHEKSLCVASVVLE
jgi:holo-[acyl-carrier protein] synthase